MPMNDALRLPAMLLFTALVAHPGGGDVTRGPEPALMPETSGRDSLGETADARMRWALHCAAVAIEAFYVSNYETYAGATVRILEDFGFQAPEGVILEILDATERHYRLEASASGGAFKSWVFDSSDALTKPGRR
jgi:hypothetical protein